MQFLGSRLSFFAIVWESESELSRVHMVKAKPKISNLLLNHIIEVLYEIEWGGSRLETPFTLGDLPCKDQLCRFLQLLDLATSVTTTWQHRSFRFDNIFKSLSPFINQSLIFVFLFNASIPVDFDTATPNGYWKRFACFHIWKCLFHDCTTTVLLSFCFLVFSQHKGIRPWRKFCFNECLNF